MDTTLRTVADRFSELGDRISSADPSVDAFAAITSVGLQVIPSAEAAAVSRGHNGSFETIAATSELPVAVDALQYELRSGPCVEVALEGGLVRAGNLLDEPRWPEFGRRAADTFGVLSMLSVRLFVEDLDVIAGLNFYAKTTEAFDESDETVAKLLAVYGGVAVTAVSATNKARNLEVALETSRHIGVAIGILMTRFLLTQEQAFDLLRVASQHAHRKLRDIALEVIETGDLELPRAH